MKITPARSASDGGEIVKIELVRQAHCYFLDFLHRKVEKELLMIYVFRWANHSNSDFLYKNYYQPTHILACGIIGQNST